jgi:hypothetical protein
MKRKTKFPFKLVIAFLIVLLIIYLSCKNIKEGNTPLFDSNNPPPPKTSSVGVGPAPVASPQPNPMTNNNSNLGTMSVAPPQPVVSTPVPKRPTFVKPILSLKDFKIMVPGPEEGNKKEPKGYALNNGQVALVAELEYNNITNPIPLPALNIFDTSRLIGGRLIFSYGGKNYKNTITKVRTGRSPNEYIVNFTGDSQGVFGGTGARGTITTGDNLYCR